MNKFIFKDSNMESSSSFIQENIKKFLNSNMFVSPDIPEKKLNNATKAFEVDNYKNIVALYDYTFFGGADEGIVFTGEGFICRNSIKKEAIKYEEISKLEYFEEEVETKPGKTTLKKYLYVYFKDNREKIDITWCMYDSDYEKLANFINTFIEEASKSSSMVFKNEDLLKPIIDMSEEFKESYLKIVVNMTFADDGDIDSAEQAEIFLLMGKIGLNPSTRIAIREYIMNVVSDGVADVKDLLSSMEKESEHIQYKNSLFSLVKDLVNIIYVTKSGDLSNIEFIKKHQELFRVTDEQLDFICTTVKNEHALLTEEVDDDVIKETMKEVSAKAVAVGVPMGAVYLSGSVIGLSAAGMTSGLATLGMGGLLGFSSMATGIGVAIILGVGAYKAVKFFTSTDEKSRYQTRELMLKEILKLHQTTISHVIEDINFIVQELNKAIFQNNEINQTVITQDEKIKYLVNMVSTFQGALGELNTNGNKIQNMESRLKCPKTIDLNKLKRLTSDATKKDYYDFVASCYQEEKEGETTKMCLRKDISTETLEQLDSVFQIIKY